MIQDLRFAFRTLFKSPGPSTVAVLVLALGIGASTIVFSLFNGLVLEPLGFERPDRLVRFFGVASRRYKEPRGAIHCTDWPVISAIRSKSAS